MNAFDIDGVISIGIHPGEEDIIITGRSIEEAKETLTMLRNRKIYNQVFFNYIPYDEKTREGSGYHKVNIIKTIGNIEIFYEDDPIQWAIIEKEIPDLKVVHIVHDLTEKENCRHPEVDGCFHLRIENFKIKNAFSHMTGLFPENCVIHLKPEKVFTDEEFKKSHPKDSNELYELKNIIFDLGPNNHKL